MNVLDVQFMTVVVVIAITIWRIHKKIKEIDKDDGENKSNNDRK